MGPVRVFPLELDAIYELCNTVCPSFDLCFVAARSRSVASCPRRLDSWENTLEEMVRRFFLGFLICMVVHLLIVEH